MRAESCQPSCRAFAGRSTCKACNITFPLVDWEDMHRAERSCEGENGLHLLKPVSHLDYTEVMILLISEWNLVASMLLSLHEEVAACMKHSLISSCMTAAVEDELFQNIDSKGNQSLSSSLCRLHGVCLSPGGWLRVASREARSMVQKM